MWEQRKKAKHARRMRGIVHENDKAKRSCQLRVEVGKLTHHDEQALLSLWQGWHWDDTKGGWQSRRFRRGKSDGKGRGGSSNYPMVEFYNDGSQNQTSHMKVPPGYAVLDCGAAKSLCGAKLVAQMAQTCAREGERVGDERDTEAIDERYHFRGIGNQIVSSFMKLRVLGSTWWKCGEFCAKRHSW